MFVSTHIHTHTQPHAHTPTHTHTHTHTLDFLSLSLSHSPTLAHSLPFHQMHTCAKTIMLPSPQTLSKKHTHTFSLLCAHPPTRIHKRTHPHAHTSAHAPQQHIHHLIIVKIPKRLKNEKKSSSQQTFKNFMFLSIQQFFSFLLQKSNRCRSQRFS